MVTARPFNSWDALKLLALALMVIDHVGHFFFPTELWIRAIGRSAMPVFLCLAGFAASYRTRWDIIVLGALLSGYNIYIAGHFTALNILLTIACCRLMLNSRQAPGSRIKHLFGWYAACFTWVFTLFLAQYGTLALLFALCGYQKRFAADYTLRQRHYFWAATFILYGAVQAFLTHFSFNETLIMCAVMIPTALLLWRTEIRPLRLPAPITAPAQWAARHTAYLYAAHLAFFMWLTGLPS